ncbi:helix-turn-helix domain-containing protein [Streptomyces sp. NPDC057136]|uniref:helix-turn-helix domain-containing protein n=1 Tax=Streptomyces sp. NPDC057136 TaxID=3346029 RepID=UPI00362B1731
MNGTVQCLAPRCERDAVRQRMCATHCERWRKYRDFDFHAWQTADPQDVAAAAYLQQLLPGMTRRERVLVGLALTDRGLPGPEVARITGVSGRTVTRWRRARRLGAEHTRRP